MRQILLRRATAEKAAQRTSSNCAETERRAICATLPDQALPIQQLAESAEGNGLGGSLEAIAAKGDKP